MVCAATVSAVYAGVVRPWLRGWGASGAELDGRLPGDDLVHDRYRTTHAVTIDTPVDDVWPELIKEDKEFADMFRGISENWHYVIPSYYFKTWLEAFSTYADFCTRAVQGSRTDIAKVKKELAPRLTEIGKSSMV